MHMQDALLSPAVGGAFWAASIGLIGYSCKKVESHLSESIVPLMGVTGAFVFAAQMINFTIPGTGSSGHLGGGIILAILLGPWAGFIVMASILMVQALFFADGGLLALGCNIFNLGVCSCFVGYPLIYKRIVGSHPSQSRLFWSAMLAAIGSLQLGSFCVVLQTTLSGISELPFGSFVAAMQPIHLAIGIVEGLVTAGIAAFLANVRPQLLGTSLPEPAKPAVSMKFVTVLFVIAAVVVGGTLSWFASSRPDGLEWSMSKTSGLEELDTPSNTVYSTLSQIQNTTALLPDYSFKSSSGASDQKEQEAAPSWPAVDAGTSISGLVGGLLTLLLALTIGTALKCKQKTPPQGLAAS